jgi:hypothetical protein
MQSERVDMLIEGMVIADRFGGKYEDRVAVYPATRWAEMARNPASVWTVARGDADDNQIQAHDSCLWNIRRAEVG